MTQKELDQLEIGDIILTTRGTICTFVVVKMDDDEITLKSVLQKGKVTIPRLGLLSEDYILKDSKDTTAYPSVTVSGYRHFIEPDVHMEIYFTDGTGICLRSKQMVKLYSILKQHVVV